MHSLFTLMLVLHVLVAVLGLGSMVSIAVVALTTRRTERGAGEVLPSIASLLRLSAVSLATMLATGIMLDLAAKGAFRGSWWFRGSVLLLIAGGALNGAARRSIRSGYVEQADQGFVLQRIERIAHAMWCGCGGNHHTDGGQTLLMTHSATADLEVFESHRPLLVAHAYRMLGDLGRAEDMVQEAWLRWDGRRGDVEVAVPRSYLVTLVTRLCLNELESARSRREESRSDRLPEPVDLDEGGFGRLEMLDQVSMAFLVVLQRLTPAERAVLLLRDVFDFDYAEEVAELVGKNEPACRKLLERARESLATEKRFFSAPPETHRRLLTAFTQAASAGDLETLVAMLAEDATLVTDGGPVGRRAAGIRNLQAPLYGARRIASFISSSTASCSVDLVTELHELNGQPARCFLPRKTRPLRRSSSRLLRIVSIASFSTQIYIGSATWARETCNPSDLTAAPVGGSRHGYGPPESPPPSDT